jgi:integrase
MAIEKIRQRADGRLFLKDRKGKDREVKADGMYGDGGGLYLQVSREGTARSWIFRYAIAPGKERAMGLGPAHTITLDRAREMARECREMRINGIDPIQARAAARVEQELAKARDVTFRAVADAWVSKEEIAWTAGTTEIVKSRLDRYAFPVLNGLPVQKIDTGLIHKVLEPIWTKNPPTAELLRQHLDGIMRFAYAKGYTAKRDTAALTGKLGDLLPEHKNFHEVKHHAAMPFAEVPKFMADLRAKRDQTGRTPGPATGGAIAPERRVISAMALEFLILTAVRKEQVASMRWDELNGDVWICEKHKTRKKTGKAHDVILSKQAMIVLDHMAKIRCNDWVFPGGRSGKVGHLRKGSIDAFQKHRMGRKDITRHGFRTAFRSWAETDGRFNLEDAEAALNHVVGNTVERIYARDADRIEPRRQLMQAWADYCDRTDPVADVVPFNRRRKA